MAVSGAGDWETRSLEGVGCTASRDTQLSWPCYWWKASFEPRDSVPFTGTINACLFMSNLVWYTSWQLLLLALLLILHKCITKGQLDFFYSILLVMVEMLQPLSKWIMYISFLNLWNFLLQDVFNLLPNLNVAELIKAFAGKESIHHLTFCSE